jgi:hypothetical protein
MKTIIIVLAIVLLLIVVCVVLVVGYMLISAQSAQRLKKSARELAAGYAGFDAATLEAGFYPTTEEIVFGVREEHDRLSSEIDLIADHARLIGFTRLDPLLANCKASLDEALKQALIGRMQTPDEMSRIMFMYAEVSVLAGPTDNAKLRRMVRQWALDVENWATVLLSFCPDFAALPES